MSGLSGSGPTSSGGSSSYTLVEIWVEAGELEVDGMEITSLSVSDSIAAVSTSAGWTWIYETKTWNSLAKVVGNVSAIDHNSTLLCSSGASSCRLGDSRGESDAEDRLVFREDEEDFGRMAALESAGNLALIASRDSIHFYNGTEVAVAAVDATTSNALALDGRWALISADEVTLYDLRLGGTRMTLSESSANAVGLGGGLAAVSDDFETLLYDLDTLRLVDTIEIGAGSLAMAEDGLIAIGNVGKGLCIVAAASGEDDERTTTSYRRDDVQGFATFVAASSNFVLAAGTNRVFAYEKRLEKQKKKDGGDDDVFGAYILLCVLVIIFCSLLVYYKKRRPYDDGTFCPNKTRAGLGERGVTQATDPCAAIPLALASSASFAEDAGDVELARPVQTVEVALPYEEESDVVTAATATVVVQPAPAPVSPRAE